MLQPGRIKSVNTLFLIFLFGFFAVFMIYPLLYILVNAFYVDGHFTFTFFWLMLQDPQIWSVILNSINLGLMVTLATTLLSIPLALIMVRTKFPGQGLLNGLLLVPMILPPFVGAVGMRQMFARFGSINLMLMQLGVTHQPVDFFGKGDILGVLIIEILHLYPIMYLNVAAALSNVDPSLEEAAQNVGAKPYQALLKITLPLVFANLLAGGILCFSFAMLEVSDSLILAAEESYYPITKAIYMLMGRPDGPFIASALGVLCMLLLGGSLMLAGKFLGRKMGELFRI